MKYKIGDFAKLVGTTVRTLRYYDEVGILKPNKIDSFTGYRIYSDKEIRKYQEIKYLQQAGFSIYEIISNIGNWNDKIFVAKRELILKKIDELRKQIYAIDYLRMHNHDGILNIDENKVLTTKKGEGIWKN